MSVLSSYLSELPSEVSSSNTAYLGSVMAERYPNPKEKIPCPKCGNKVQRAGIRCHNHSMHEGQRRRVHMCPFCSRSNPKTYSTFRDWKRHIKDPHPPCLVGGEDDPLVIEEYTAGFKLDRWHRFHGITGDELVQSFLKVSSLRNDYGSYQGKREGTETPSPGPQFTIHLPHSKEATPDRHQTSTGSEQADGEISRTDLEESGDGPEEGVDQDQNYKVFTGIRWRGSNSESKDASRGQDSWRDARGREAPHETAKPVAHPRG